MSEKESFERFYEYLCEDIFEDFPTEDCVKYEGVSKLWKRTIYRNINKFVIRDNKIVSMKRLFTVRQLRKRMPALTQLLAKCPKITHFYIEPRFDFNSYPKLNPIIVELIVKFCPNLKSIDNSSVGLRHISAKPFIQSIGHKLESICLCDSIQNFEELSGQRFPKLERLRISYSSYPPSRFVTQIDSSFESSFSITRLTHLKVCYPIFGDNFLQTIIRSNKGLKYIYLWIDLFTKDIRRSKATSEDLLTDLSTLEELKSLRICLGFDFESKTILEKFKSIGQKCHKLETFVFDGEYCNQEYCGDIPYFIEYFPNLVTLELYHMQGYNWFTSCKVLANCQLLRYLKLEIDLCSSFKDIDTYLPNLRLLSINVYYLNERLIDSIGKLVHLQRMILGIYYDQNCRQLFEPTLPLKLFDKNPRLKSFELNLKRDYCEDIEAILSIERTYSGAVVTHFL